jgi:hypothetical protein
METEQEKEDRLQKVFLKEQKIREVDLSYMCSLCVLRFKKWMGASDKTSLAKIWRCGVRKLNVNGCDDFFADGRPRCPDCNKKMPFCPECSGTYCCFNEYWG